MNMLEEAGNFLSNNWADIKANYLYRDLQYATCLNNTRLATSDDWHSSWNGDGVGHLRYSVSEYNLTDLSIYSCLASKDIRFMGAIGGWSAGGFLLMLLLAISSVL